MDPELPRADVSGPEKEKEKVTTDPIDEDPSPLPASRNPPAKATDSDKMAASSTVAPVTSHERRNHRPLNRLGKPGQLQHWHYRFVEVAPYIDDIKQENVFDW